jgi:hypothetical protein
MNGSGYKRGDHVKVVFADEVSGERKWMWIDVDFCDDFNKVLFGHLDSKPVVRTDLRLGEQLTVSY